MTSKTDVKFCSRISPVNICFTINCTYDVGGGGLGIYIGGCGTPKKRGGGSYVRVQLEKRGVLGAGQVKKGGLYRGTYLY